MRKTARWQDFDVADPELYRADSFDVVTMDQAIEHVTDPVMPFGGIERLSKPWGQVILSILNVSVWRCKVFGSPLVCWHAPYHLPHSSRESIEQASCNAGLELQRLAGIADSGRLRYQGVDLLTRPALEEVSPFWSRAQNRAVRNRCWLATLIHLPGVDHLLTCVFDLLPQRDNQLLFVRKPL